MSSRTRNRFLSTLLALAMLLSLLPTAAFAAGETGTWTEVNWADIQPSDTIAITVHGSATDKTYVMKNDGGTSTKGPAAEWDSSNTVDTSWYWNVIPSDGGYRICPAGDTQNWLYCINDNNGLRVGTEFDTVWNLDSATGYLSCVDSGGNTRYMGIYDNNNGDTSVNPNFRTYKNTTGNTKNQTTTFYKLEGEGGEVTPPDPEEPKTITIAEALATAVDTENLAVKGVVTLLDGQNVYLQDSTGGICARMSDKFDDIALGDTIIATGKRAVYNGLPQLGNSTYEKSSGLTLTPAVKTIGELTTADICTYVTIQNVEVTEVFDNNGAYSNPNITVEDSSGNTIQLYKAVVGEKNGDGTWPVAVGDVITITGAVGVYNTTLQLRNTSASEIKAAGASTGPIYGGEQVVIYNPAYHMALSGTYNGFYNNGTAVEEVDGILRGFTANDVWTVIDNGDSTWSFSYNDQKIGMGDSFSSMPLGEKNDKWVLEDAGNGLYYIKNTVRNAYMEWYAEKNNWSSYGKISAGSEGMFALSFYKVTEIPEEPSGDLPEAGDEVVLYNEGAKGVLAGGDGNETSPSINNAEATVADGVATPANGARVFTVEVNGEWFRFKTSDGYLCSNGTGNNAFYSAEATEDADWKLTSFNGGFNLESRTAKFNGKYSQYLEYYAGSYKTYSLYNDSDKDIYTFNFYPVAEGVTVTDGVVNMPAVTFGTLSDAYVGQEYSVSFTVDSVFGVQEISAKYGDIAAELTEKDGTYSFTIPSSAMTAGNLVITINGTDNKDVTFTGTTTLAVKDEPYILTIFPTPNSQTGENKQPEIGFTFGNAGEDPTVTMTVNDTPVELTVSDGKASYTPAEAMADGKVTVTATVTRADEKTVSRTWNFTVGVAQYQLYFGQLHSHTAQYSDGAGTLQEGLDYVANLSEDDNVDFVAFTDHSNYFDSSSNANPEEALYDVGQMTAESKEKWDAYKGAVAAFNASQSDVVALAGFEMTWSGGPGHINTFNTPGIVSRNNKTLNDKTADAGMKAYYALLSNENLVNSISQFNHPGTTFGNFSDFGYYDPIIDTRMYLVEVGNGEGAIGAGGYYPSYEQYIMALDKGWHVAPTNNQDNHKGKWGNANDARDVVLTDDFSEEGIYDAIRNYRVYATEDKNLEIQYTLNGQMLGSIISDVPDEAAINVSVYDPDGSDSISKVEVVVNSGAVAYTWDDPTELASGELSCTIPANYSYYFIRVTQGDGDLAVTAPVWVGDVVKLGISSVECGTATPVTGEELTLNTTLFNSESNPATVKSITYTSGSETLGTDNTERTIPASGTLAVEWGYVPDMARVMTVTVTVVLVEDDIEYTYSKDISLDILDASKLVYIGIDASHYNEYVNGNYKDSMGNFGNLAAGYSVRTVQLNTSDDLIAACENKDNKYKAIILTAPSRRDGDDLRKPYATYSEEEIQAIADFNAAGGAVVVAGWSDYYESYKDFPDTDHMAAQQNKVLEALGSSLRIGDDATNDDKLNGGQTQRLYFSTYNWDNFLMDGVEFDPENPNNNLYSQLFSQYGGASIYVVDEDGKPTTEIPATVSPVVYGHDTTYSVDSDNDGLGGDSMPKYTVAEGDERLMVLATEQMEGKGLIVVSGAAFMSNFEVQAQIGDSGSEKNYSNYNICENLVNYINPITITPIKDVQAQKDEGIKYTIEGVVTSNASGYDKDTAFFDCIYVQDGTAGINAFPVAGNYKIGDKVRITGTTSSYQGERQIAVTSIEKIGELGEGETVEPKIITTKEAAQSTYLGSLVQINGVVVSFAEAEGLVQTIIVRDKSGYDARVFIDGYITKDKAIENLAVGHEITVTGLSSYDTSFDGPAARIRVRDRADIVCGTEVVDIPPVHVDPEDPVNPPYVPDDDDDDDDSTTIKDPDTPLGPGVFTDLDQDAWYYDDVSTMIEQGLLVGVSTDRFAPEWTVSRAMLASVLYRMSGEKYTGFPTFLDVPRDAWYRVSVAWASTNGVVYGYSAERFGPDDDVTREQLVTMLYRYQQYMDNDVSKRDDLSAFSDAGQVSSFAQEAMQWAVAEGLIQGRSGNLLAPTGTASRAELCSILVRFQALNS
ncbi:S-layer homology domain-containing protein [Flavonifractor sp. An92]|uniref:S-layer homology domain-containing protein n=1 Tax=Flavonifractor sp. An92 TaxID=1965666 RepID=UPI00117B1F19|nr:S-layer homology domain-containing protein [Flavonifractor sp. An92]